jgi:hypothetical protein
MPRGDIRLTRNVGQQSALSRWRATVGGCERSAWRGGRGERFTLRGDAVERPWRPGNGHDSTECRSRGEPISPRASCTLGAELGSQALWIAAVPTLEASRGRP